MPAQAWNTLQHRFSLNHLIWVLSFTGKGPNSLLLWDKSQLSTALYHNNATVVSWTWLRRTGPDVRGCVKVKYFSATGTLLLEKLTERKPKKLPLFCLSKGLHFNKLRTRLNPNLTAELHGTNEPYNLCTHQDTHQKGKQELNPAGKSATVGLHSWTADKKAKILCMFCYWKWGADQEHVDRILLVYQSLIHNSLVKFCFQIITVPHQTRYIHKHHKPRLFQVFQKYPQITEKFLNCIHCVQQHLTCWSLQNAVRTVWQLQAELWRTVATFEEAFYCFRLCHLRFPQLQEDYYWGQQTSALKTNCIKKDNQVFPAFPRISWPILSNKQGSNN